MAGRNSADYRFGVVALISGGLDSSIMTGMALERGDLVWPLYVRQGFVWESAEEGCVRHFLERLNSNLRARLGELQTACLSAPRSFPSRWAVDSGEAPPNAETADDAVYLPGRNLALLTAAALTARSVGAHMIQLGILSDNPFPDATPAFIAGFERLAREALKWDLRVEMPLAHLTKSEVLQLGARMPLGQTLSCLAPVEGRHCGRCNKCAERARAFRCADLPDPTLYETQRPMASPVQLSAPARPAFY